MKTLSILGIGNSFSMDTTHFLAEAALGCGIEQVNIANLYIGGCSIEMHADNARKDAPAYELYENDGSGWVITPKHKISDALKKRTWDHVFIQHGSKNGSRYTLERCYDRLPELARYVRATASGSPVISFNMTWSDTECSTRPEPVFYNHDQVYFMKRLFAVTKAQVLPAPYIDKVVPTGTAIQNLRAGTGLDLSRDGVHMDKSLGRYAAAVGFLHGLCGIDISNISWAPDGVTPVQKRAVIKAALAASANPYEITPVGFEA